MCRVARRRVRRSNRRQHGLDGSAGNVAVGDLDEVQLATVATSQQVDRCVGIALADRLGERPDRGVGGGPMLAGETHDATCQRRPRFGGTHDVAEHGPDLDAGELVGIADENQPALVRHGLEQPRRQRQREHRRLVDDEEVEVQRIAGVVAEPSAMIGSRSEQAVHRHGPQLRQARRGGGVEFTVCQRTLGRRGNRLGEPARRLPGRCGETDAHLLPAGDFGGEQTGNGMGLPGARAAGDHGQRRSGGDAGGHVLLVVLAIDEWR